MKSARMRKVLLAAALIVPLAVFAQSAVFTLTSPDAISGQIYVGASNCGSKVITFNWDLGVGQPAAGSTALGYYASTSGECNNASAPTGTDRQVNVPQVETSTLQDSASNAIVDQSDAGLAGGCSNTTRSSANPYTTYFCLQLRNSAITGTTVSSLNIPINFATAPPTPPTSVTAEGGDTHLRVDWQQGNTAEKIQTYDVHVLAQGQTFDTSKFSQRVTAQTNASVDHTDTGAALQNNVPYTVQVVANDFYGNVSAPSTPITGTPVKVLDFYGIYRNEGGGATGGHGCSSAGGETWAVLLGLSAALAMRRKRAAPFVAALALLGPLAARAADSTDLPPRKLLFAFKIDRYDPKVDSEPGLTGSPYHTIFGTRAPLRYQLEGDWEIAHPFGTFLLGATVGFWQNYGKGVVADASGNPVQPLQRSSDTALLNVFPIGVIATYRFDWLADRYLRFPLIPYAQVGLMEALWVAKNGNGDVSNGGTAGGRGSGWTRGYTTALGFAFNLNAIDPDVAREAYTDIGIQRTSLFAEYGWTYLSNFHQRGALILSDHAWRFGLALEF